MTSTLSRSAVSGMTSEPNATGTATANSSRSIPRTVVSFGARFCLQLSCKLRSAAPETSSAVMSPANSA